MVESLRELCLSVVFTKNLYKILKAVKIVRKIFNIIKLPYFS